MGRSNKISKSDKIDKAQEARDREWLAHTTESPHFKVGSDVLYMGIKFTIDRYEGRTVYLREGRIVIPVHNPYFMR